MEFFRRQRGIVRKIERRRVDHNGFQKPFLGDDIVYYDSKEWGNARMRHV